MIVICHEESLSSPLKGRHLTRICYYTDTPKKIVQLPQRVLHVKCLGLVNE